MIPTLRDHDAYGQWVELGRPDLYDRVRKRVEEILASPQKKPLADNVIGNLENIIGRVDEVLK